MNGAPSRLGLFETRNELPDLLRRARRTQTVRYLERSGHTAAHVREALSLGVDDEEVAAYAVEQDYVLLTNDRGFLDGSRYPDLTVLCYTDNEAEAYELSAMIEDVVTYYPTQEELPRAVFLP